MRKMILSFVLCGALVPVHALEAERAPMPVAQRVVTAAEVNGTWRSGENEFRVWAIGNQQLRVDFHGVFLYRLSGGERTANLGSGSGIARIEGDTATFKPDDTEDECLITMRFARGRLIVTQRSVCNFGHNVSANGTYRRVSARRPTFGIG